MHADVALTDRFCVPVEALPEDVRRHGDQYRQRTPQEGKFGCPLVVTVYAEVFHVRTHAGAGHAGVDGATSCFGRGAVPGSGVGVA